MEPLIRWLRENWSTLLAIPMLALGAFVLTSTTIWKYVGYCVLMGFGLVMLIYPHKNNLYNVGFFALGMGSSRVFTAIPYFLSDFDGAYTVGNIPLGLFYGIVILAIGSSLLYTGYMFFKGYARAYRRMIYTSSLIFVGTMIIAAFNVFLYDITLPSEFVDNVLLSSGNVFTGVLYGVLAVVLNSDMIRRNGYYEKVAIRLGEMGGVVNAPASLVMSRSDADMISEGFRGCDGWTPVNDGGPADREVVVILGDGKNVQYLTAQHIAGRDGIRVTMSENRSGSVIQAFRFIAKGILIEECQATLYGDKGVMARFRIGGDADEV